MSIKLPKDQEADAAIGDSGLEMMACDAGFRYYRIRVNPKLDDKHRDVLALLVKQARAGFGKGA